MNLLLHFLTSLWCQATITQPAFSSTKLDAFPGLHILNLGDVTICCETTPSIARARTCRKLYKPLTSLSDDNFASSYDTSPSRRARLSKNRRRLMVVQDVSAKVKECIHCIVIGPLGGGLQEIWRRKVHSFQPSVLKYFWARPGGGSVANRATHGGSHYDPIRRPEIAFSPSVSA